MDCVPCLIIVCQLEGFIMAKLSYEDKKEIVRLYNDEHHGYRHIADLFEVNKSTIQRIVRKYNMHGEDSLIRKSNRKFPADLKLEIINRAMNGEPKRSLAVEYKICEAQIIDWLKKYEENGYNSLNDKPKGRAPSMKKEKKSADSNDKDAVIRSQADRIMKLEAEVEALKN